MVRVGGKERAVSLGGVAVLDEKGKALKEADAAGALRPGARVEITERGGEVTEVRLRP